jgi:hypothetical protein
MVEKSRKELESISKFGVKSDFQDFSFGGNPLGIYGSLTMENFHAWLLGLIEYLLQSVYSHVEEDDDVSDWCDRRYSVNTTTYPKSRPVPKNATTKVDQAEFERRVKIEKEVSLIQSDRDVPKTPFNHGVTCLTRLTGQKFPSLGDAYHGVFRRNTSFKKYAEAKFDQEIFPFIVANIVSKCLPEQARKDGK